MTEIVLEETLGTEEYVVRRIWLHENLSADAVRSEKVGAIAISGQGTWRWHFLRHEDAMLFQLTWL